MDCSMRRLEVSMTPDRKSVVITLRCTDAYEAAVLLDTVAERARAGSIHLDFRVATIDQATKESSHG